MVGVLLIGYLMLEEHPKGESFLKSGRTLFLTMLNLFNIIDVIPFVTEQFFRTKCVWEVFQLHIENF